ncbi:MAG TPA: phosphate ABC transporter permease subunit PstC [Tepidisphaeraceae bacterium]
MSEAGLQPGIVPYRSPQPQTKAAKTRRISGDALLHGAATGGTLCIFFMLAALLAVLFYAAMPSIREFGFHFLISSEWRPNELEQPQRGPDGKLLTDQDGQTIMETIPPAFGALPVIYGTAMSSALSLIFAVPLSLGAAIFLVRVAPNWLKPPVSFLVEFLAAIPSIAYGIWGLFILAPFLQAHIEPAIQHLLQPLPFMQWMFQDTITIVRPLSLTGRDMFSGSLVLAIMIVPIITAISRDVLRQVPRAQVEGSVALGATWWQSSKEMLKYSRSGLFGAVMLGLARAAGETMAVTMVIGNNNQIVPSPFAPAQTMSSLLANEFAEASTAMHRSALCEVALILLLMSLIFNMVARWLVVGKGSRSAATQ